MKNKSALLCKSQLESLSVKFSIGSQEVLRKEPPQKYVSSEIAIQAEGVGQDIADP